MQTPDTIKATLNSLYQNGNFLELINFCNTQIELDDSNYVLFGARGKAHIELQNFQKAIADISHAIELFPEYAVGYYNRGISYYETDKNELAIIDFEHARELNYESYDIDYYLGACHCFINKYAKAIDCFSTYLSNTEDYEILKWRADLYITTEQFDKANLDIAKILHYESSCIEVTEKFEKINKVDANSQQSLNQIIVSGLAEIGFSVFEPTINSAGIYILQFFNNEHYVGQAKNLQNRIKQHYKKYDDIHTVYYKLVDSKYLLEEENAAISILEANCYRLRNLKQIQFLNIFDKSNQVKWVTDNSFNFISGIKFHNNNVKEKYSDNFKLLKSRPFFDDLISILQTYIKKCIPNYLASEFNYWNITCLPKYLKKTNCISRININSVPVLSVFEEPDLNSMTIMIFASKYSFMKYIQHFGIDKFLENISSVQLDLRDAFSDKTDEDEITLLIDKDNFIKTINNDMILSSIRLFNLRMMNNVGNEEKYRRATSHCSDLSDFLLNIQ